MNRCFIDMDGVLADFVGLKEKLGLTGEQLKAMPGAFAALEPLPGALDAVRSIIGMGFEVWIASKPATGHPHTYSEKVDWILRHLPELKRRIILTHHKGMLGDVGDVLVDDRPHKANCDEFRGTVLHFSGPVYKGWPEVLDFFRRRRSSAQPVEHRAQPVVQ